MRAWAWGGIHRASLVTTSTTSTLIPVQIVSDVYNLYVFT